VQHALRAFTPRDQKAVKSAADTMRPNPAVGNMAAAITELGVGEALVSLLDEKGRPGVTERVYVLPPGSRIGPVTPAERTALVQGSLVAGTYEKTVDRESAFELLQARAATEAGGPAAAAGGAGPAGGPSAPAGPARPGVMDGLKETLFGSVGPRGGVRPGLAQTAAQAALRTVGNTIGRELVRGVMGSLLGSKRR